MIKSCPICHKEFKIKPSHFERRKFCSFKCKGISQIGKEPWSKGKVFSAEYRKKLSESHMGNAGYWTGKKFTPERCQAISDRMRGYKFNRKKSDKLIVNGYVRIYFPNHPKRSKSGYVPEHRIVAEQSIGRHLSDKEIVHHRNEVLFDNTKDNLYIFENNVIHLAFHLLVRKHILPLDILKSNLDSYK